MKRKTVNSVILLGIVAITSILFIQLFWIKKTIQAQALAITIQEKEDSLNTVRFSERAHIALRDVLEQLAQQTPIPTNSANLYGAVKQLSVNYFLVDMSDEVVPDYLETLLMREFDHQSLNQDFIYGIYDCYSDSIEFSSRIHYTKANKYKKTAATSSFIRKIKQPWQKDGHYFTVKFPDLTGHSINRIQQIDSPWIYLIAISALVLSFFAFAISIILRQKRLSEIKTDFINNMTHELKTPIATIGLSSELLMRSDFSTDVDKLKKYAEIIYKENKRLEQQVERVLNVAKLDKEKLVLKKDWESIHTLLAAAKESFEINQTDSGATISLQCEASIDRLYIDEVHITNVIYNLLDNAVKYCNETPHISITTQSNASYFILTVTDNGIGIQKEDVKLIFDKFYRVPTGNLHNVKGFGLGLYYVKLITEAHEGYIKVKSNLGSGTNFELYLPLTKIDQ